MRFAAVERPHSTESAVTCGTLSAVAPARLTNLDRFAAVGKRFFELPNASMSGAVPLL